MRSMLISYALGALVCLGLGSAAPATIVFDQEEWGTRLDSDQSITCIAHYIPDTPDVPESLVFDDVPERTYTYTGGDWTDWETAISEDKKTVYLYGPRQTNSTNYNDIGWFSYNLFFKWDDADPLLDPEWPVYIDTAIFDGGPGSPATDAFFWKGEPGAWPDNWVYQDYPHDPDWETVYTNPAPEPATVCLLGIGGYFLMRRRR